MQLPIASHPEKKNGLQRSLEFVILFWVAVFAFQITYLAGERGFFAFDQSIVFDGGYRIVSGQIPFKDFVIPFGPMVFWLQGAFFKLLGINYGAYIFGAAAVNTVMTLGVYALLRMLFPPNKLPAYLGALLTAVWFYAPFGTPWPEQTAFFFSFIALFLVLIEIYNPRISSRGRVLLNLTAGLAAFASFISKQNAGAFFVPIIGLLYLIVDAQNLRRLMQEMLTFSAGWLGGALAFITWLLLRADMTLFYRYFFVIPAAEVSADRLPVGMLAWLHALLIGEAPPLAVALSMAAVLIALAALWAAPSSLRQQPRIQIAAALPLALMLFHNLYLITSNNQPENSLPFIGLMAAISLGLWMRPIAARPPRFKSASPLLTGALILLMALSLWQGANIAISRQTHSIFRQSEFHQPLETRALSAIHWAEPTRIHRLITAAEIDQLVANLTRRGENFFIFPDFTIFYGVVGVPSPQPLLWFHNGLTYSKTYDPALDAWIVADLRQNRVAVIIIEQESWFYSDQLLAGFPLLEAFIAEEFTLDEQIGIFNIYVQKTD